MTTESHMYTVVMGIQRMIYVADNQAMWNLHRRHRRILAMLPPVLVVVLMQRLFIKGLIEVEK